MQESLAACDFSSIVERNFAQQIALNKRLICAIAPARLQSGARLGKLIGEREGNENDKR